MTHESVSQNIFIFQALEESEKSKYRDHLCRLDPASRRQRFAHAVSDSFIDRYVDLIMRKGHTVLAYLDEGEVRAAAEIATGDRCEAEIALSVEQALQGQGLGTCLMNHVVESAGQLGITALILTCLPGNARMQALARRHRARVTYYDGDVCAVIPVEPAAGSTRVESKMTAA